MDIDTPESVKSGTPVEPFADEASAFTKRLVEGKMVIVLKDVNVIDFYGRTPGHVILEDGTLLNAELLKAGLARIYTKYPFRYQEDFEGYEQEAKEARLGIWKDNLP